MIKWVLLTGNLVINVIVPPAPADQAQFVQAEGDQGIDNIIQVDESVPVAGGFTYDGNTFIPPVEEPTN